MANRRDNQFTWNPHNRATVLDCNFIVDSTNGNGFGVRSLDKGGRIATAFMNTSAAFTGTSHTSTSITGIASGTATLAVGMPVQGSGIAAGTTIASIVSSSAITLSAATSSSTTGSITYQGIAANGQTNPNPEAGLLLVTLQDNYNAYRSGYAGFVAPLSGTPINVTTGVSQGLAYVITTLGTTTTAQWQVLGLPLQLTPAPGVAFIAPATATATGTGTIEVPATGGSGIDHIEVIGDANLMNNTLGGTTLGQGLGMQFVLACYKNGTLTAPANGTVIGMNFYLNNSAQGV
jgi:hypothetical protein